MFFGITKFSKITNFEIVKDDIGQQKVSAHLLKQQDQHNTNTSESQSLFSLENQYKKGTQQHQEVSFGENLIKQHTEAYHFYVSHYMEKRLQYKIQGKLSFSNTQVFNVKSPYVEDHNQTFHYLKSRFCPLEKEKAEEFAAGLTCQEKLLQFLNLVCVDACDQIAGQLLAIAFEVWEEYLRIQIQQLSYLDIIKHSWNFMEHCIGRFLTDQKVCHLALNKYKNEDSAVLRKETSQLAEFLGMFMTTIFLICEEYIENPLYAKKTETQLKKHAFFCDSLMLDSGDNFSEDEEQYSSTFLRGKKKIRTESN